MTAPGTQILTNIQVGKETVFGTAVARTRKFYGVSTGALDHGLEYAMHEGENRGIKTRGGRAPTLIRTAPKFRLADVDGIGYDDLVLPLSCGLKGGLTGSGAGADKTWTFEPSNTATNAYESMCLDIGDDVQNFTLAGVVPTSWSISATAGEPTHFTADLVGASIVKGAATNLSNITPTQIGGSGMWTLKHASSMANLGAASVVTAFLRSFEYTYNPGRLPQYYLEGSLGMGAVAESYIEGELKLTVDSTALAISEYWDKWQAGTLDFVRLKVTGDALGGTNYSLTLDMPTRWLDVKPIAGETDGINTYEVTGRMEYDSVSTKSLSLVLVCSLSAIP